MDPECEAMSSASQGYCRARNVKAGGAVAATVLRAAAMNAAIIKFQCQTTQLWAPDPACRLVPCYSAGPQPGSAPLAGPDEYPCYRVFRGT